MKYIGWDAWLAHTQSQHLQRAVETIARKLDEIRICGNLSRFEWCDVLRSCGKMLFLFGLILSVFFRLLLCSTFLVSGASAASYEEQRDAEKSKHAKKFLLSASGLHVANCIHFLYPSFLSILVACFLFFALLFHSRRFSCLMMTMTASRSQIFMLHRGIQRTPFLSFVVISGS